MISVVRTPNTLTVSGHAGYAEYGTDVVCAAASMLFYALCEGLNGMGAEWDLRESENGEHQISVKTGGTTTACAALDVIGAGYKLLASQHPDNVVYKQRNADQTRG